jgi:hypothetical protein
LERPLGSPDSDKDDEDDDDDDDDDLDDNFISSSSPSFPKIRKPWTVRPWVVELVRSSVWDPVFAYLFRQRGHINPQECKTIRTAIRWLGRENPDSKTLLIADTRVGLGIISRGRASSPSLNYIQRGCVPSMLGGGLYLGGIHTPSEHNPVDDDSRRRRFEWDVEPRPAWFLELEHGCFGAFDDEINSSFYAHPWGSWVRMVLRGIRVVKYKAVVEALL